MRKSFCASTEHSLRFHLLSEKNVWLWKKFQFTPRGKHFKAIGPWKASAKLHIHTPSQECCNFYSHCQSCWNSITQNSTKYCVSGIIRIPLVIDYTNNNDDYIINRLQGLRGKHIISVSWRPNDSVFIIWLTQFVSTTLPINWQKMRNPSCLW